MWLFHRHRLAPAAVLTPIPLPVRTADPVPAVAVTYTVIYDYVGDWGRRDLPAPAPRTIPAGTRGEVASAIERDLASYVAARAGAKAVVDLGKMCGLIRLGDRTIGAFTLQMDPGGERP